MTSIQNLYSEFGQTIYFHQFHNRDRKLPFTLQLVLDRLVILIIQFKQFLASPHRLIELRIFLLQQD
jgi:hypothetical protein